MTYATPCRLPECFQWQEDAERRRLFLDGVEVLEVRRRLRGWVVHVHLTDASSPHPEIAVRSIDAGMRWGARWSKLHAARLAALVAHRQHASARQAANDQAAASSAA